MSTEAGGVAQPQSGPAQPQRSLQSRPAQPRQSPQSGPAQPQRSPQSVPAQPQRSSQLKRSPQSSQPARQLAAPQLKQDGRPERRRTQGAQQQADAGRLSQVKPERRRQLKDAKVGWESPRTASPPRPVLEGSHGKAGDGGVTVAVAPEMHKGKRQVIVLQQAGLRGVVVRPERTVSMAVLGRPPPALKSPWVVAVWLGLMPVWCTVLVYGYARDGMPVWLSTLSMLCGLAHNLVWLIMLNVDLLLQLFRCFEVWYLLAQVGVFTVAMADMMSWDARCICLAVLPFSVSMGVLSDSAPIRFRRHAALIWSFGFVAWVVDAAGLYFEVLAVVPRDFKALGFTLNTARIALSCLGTLATFSVRYVVSAARFPTRYAVLRASVAPQGVDANVATDSHHVPPIKKAEPPTTVSPATALPSASASAPPPAQG